MSILPMIRDFFPYKQGPAHIDVLHAGGAQNAEGAVVFASAPAEHQKWIENMANQLKTNHQNRIKEGGPLRSAQCIPKMDEEEKRQNHYLDITAMIRSLQRTEGVSDCFRRGIADCDQLRCSWRQYCLEPTDDLSSENDV